MNEATRSKRRTPRSHAVRGNEWKRGAVLVSSTLWLLGLLGGCSHREGKTEDQEAIPQVQTAHPQPRTIVREVKQPGYLRPYEETPIYAKIAGYIQDIKVDRGSIVKKGDLLAKLWVPEMESNLRAQEARVVQAEADLEQAKQAIVAARATVASSEARIREMEAGVNRASAERDRWQAEVVRADDLLSKNIYDRQTRDEARNQFRASEAAVNESRAKVASAQALYQENIAKLHKAEADRDAVAARLGVTKADRQQQKDWLGYAELRAPMTGLSRCGTSTRAPSCNPPTPAPTAKRRIPCSWSCARTSCV